MRLLNFIKRVYLQIDSFVYPIFILPIVAFQPATLAYGVAVFRADVLSRLKKDSLREAERSIELLFGSRFSPEARRHVAPADVFIGSLVHGETFHCA